MDYEVVIPATLGTVIALVWIVLHHLSELAKTRERELTKRALAEQIANGKIDVFAAETIIQADIPKWERSKPRAVPKAEAAGPAKLSPEA